MARKKADPATPKGEESKREKFLRLASARTSKAIDAIRTLANLSGPGYEYTPEDVQKMEEAFKAELGRTFQALKKREATAKARSFSL
jgi:hypothetical protein